MTRPGDPFERVRNANPVPSAVEPDWGTVKELLAAAADSDPASAPSPPSKRLRRSRVSGLLAGLALCAVAATIAALALAPAGRSSDFLAKAAAALTPASGTVLYERWETTIGREPSNRDRPRSTTFGPEQLWIEGNRPRRYRTVLQPHSDSTEAHAAAGLAYAYGVTIGSVGDPFNFGKEQGDMLPRLLGQRTRQVDVPAWLQQQIAGKPLELGGTVESPTGKTNRGAVQPTLTFLPTNELLRARIQVTIGPTLPGPHDQIIENGSDPVSVLRAAIAEGRAHAAGASQLSGHSVLRIDLDLPHGPPADAPPLPANHPVFHSEAYAYVDPGSFHPVEIVYGLHTYRFLAYEYLPATAANLALTDIRAQHPRTRILDTVPREPQAGKPRR